MNDPEYKFLSQEYAAFRAVRTWDSDGSQNVMSLAAAAMNLASRGLERATARRAAERLLAGETLETPCASFKVCLGGLL